VPSVSCLEQPVPWLDDHVLVVPCDWEGCGDDGNHSVVITFPDLPRETWRVCRKHERQLKLQAVRSRPPKPADTAPPESSVTVSCGACRTALDEERADLEGGEPAPCPTCGSLTRHIAVAVTLRATATVHEAVRVRRLCAGKGGWRVQMTSGDSYTRDLAAWGAYTQTVDREDDLYCEVIELYDGTKIESTARLQDHR
jgi:hypothetical protein